MKAYLIFSNKGKSNFNFLLNKDFKHCLIGFQTKDKWVFVDPLTNGLKITKILTNKKRKLIHRITKLGCLVLEVNCENFNHNFISQNKSYKNSCVSFAKKVLSLSKPQVLTPYQLYHYFSKNNLINSKYHHPIYENYL